MMGDVATAFLGGILIGGACIAYLVLLGRIAGISGMVRQIAELHTDKAGLTFLTGLVLSPCLWRLGTGAWPGFSLDQPWFVLLPAGLLVGWGTQMACGCTSGHGVVGLARLSRRSFVAVLCFMVTAITAATFFHHLGY